VLERILSKPMVVGEAALGMGLLELTVDLVEVVEPAR
jgi:hypothetical protein